MVAALELGAPEGPIHLVTGLVPLQLGRAGGKSSIARKRGGVLLPLEFLDGVGDLVRDAVHGEFHARVARRGDEDLADAQEPVEEGGPDLDAADVLHRDLDGVY